MSKAVSLSIGYTGMWLGSITRASTNTEFQASARPVVSAQLQDPNQPPSESNTWIPTRIDDVPEATDLRVYNSVGPREGNDLGYLFVNGVDFGLEINY